LGLKIADSSSSGLQQPTWPNQADLVSAISQLEDSEPIANHAEIDTLTSALAEAAFGRAFVIQGGDCAEIFAEANATRIRNKLRTMLQMAVILMHGSSLPVIKIGRMAGQYAKPRSSDTEQRGEITLPVYRGDMVNGYEFTAAARTPNPYRMVKAHSIARATGRVVKGFVEGGYADLRDVHQWNRGFMKNTIYARYEETARQIDSAIRFMAAAGTAHSNLKTTDFYLSHEALLLDYERALVRVNDGLRYGTSGHFLWLGERTRQIDGDHVRFLASIENPVGVKLGPSASPKDVRSLANKLNPSNKPGKLTFITRMGAGRIRESLPPIISSMKNDGLVATWVTDPMHGNTITAENGYKTRRFTDILDEVTGFFEVHRDLGTVPGGIHMELTGDDVTEVIGGSGEIDESTLARRYETLVDPRLNHEQSLETAFLVSHMLSNHKSF
jgi:3-deoxy-7-phosphoheptulonate synthase